MGDAILRNKQLAIGNGAEYTNVFPLLHTLGVQDHWKADNRPQARLSAHALRVSRPAARRRDGLVGRRVHQLLGALASGSRRAELRAQRLSLLDHRHRRLLAGLLPALLSSLLIRNSMRAGLSSEPSVPSSAPTAIGRTTSFGPTTRSSRR